MRTIRPCAIVLAAALSTWAGPFAYAQADDDLSRLEKASRLLEQVRELRFKSPVQERKLNQDELEVELNRVMDEELTAEEEVDLVALLSRLGLVPNNYPLRERTLELLAYQVAGFYEPDSGMMVTVATEEKEKQSDEPVLIGVEKEMFDQIILLHELDHALCDQHFDLKAILDDTAEISREDQLVARHALAEGDATLAMMIAQLQVLGAEFERETFPLEQLSGALEMLATTELVPGAAAIPKFLQDELIQPYILGFDRVARTWRKGGWEAVNAMWSNPPQSTEQLLHEDRAEDEPQLVELPRKHRRARSAIDLEIGELGMRTWLGLHLEQERAQAAAAGWDGDRVGLYRRKRSGEEHVVWATVWDDAEQATEFAAAARDWLQESQVEGEVTLDETSVRVTF